jgi:hypothetical protein
MLYLDKDGTYTYTKPLGVKPLSMSIAVRMIIINGLEDENIVRVYRKKNMHTKSIFFRDKEGFERYIDTHNNVMIEKNKDLLEINQKVTKNIVLE